MLEAAGWGRGRYRLSGQRDAGLELRGQWWREPRWYGAERGAPRPMAAARPCLRLLPVCILGCCVACGLLRAHLGPHAAACGPRRPLAQRCSRSVCSSSTTRPASGRVLLAWGLRWATTAARTAAEPPPQPPPSSGSDAGDHTERLDSLARPHRGLRLSVCTSRPRLRGAASLLAKVLILPDLILPRSSPGLSAHRQ